MIGKEGISHLEGGKKWKVSKKGGKTLLKEWGARGNHHWRTKLVIIEEKEPDREKKEKKRSIGRGRLPKEEGISQRPVPKGTTVHTQRE